MHFGYSLWGVFSHSKGGESSQRSGILAILSKNDCSLSIPLCLGFLNLIFLLFLGAILEDIDGFLPELTTFTIQPTSQSIPDQL